MSRLRIKRRNMKIAEMEKAKEEAALVEVEPVKEPVKEPAKVEPEVELVDEDEDEVDEDEVDEDEVIEDKKGKSKSK